ncbi:hypothetical protein BRC93_01315 [Halobacteriales archaeon QS_5_70_15]|nr:MAG: hypothetical protein BRC93_01315 [Halobacteriales archaeon QS_5_70_15]
MQGSVCVVPGQPHRRRVSTFTGAVSTGGPLTCWDRFNRFNTLPTVKEELENYYEKEIHHGRLYPNLDTLVEKGLVEKGNKDRRTNYYTLTRRGRGEIEDRREWEDQYVGEVVPA